MLFSMRPSGAVESKKSMPLNIQKTQPPNIEKSEKGMNRSYVEAIRSACNVDAVRSHNSVNHVGTDGATGNKKEQNPKIHLHMSAREEDCEWLRGSFVGELIYAK
ncbi:hypothetical protein Ancab_019034 [Ancistrocladus abbreviatus]